MKILQQIGIILGISYCGHLMANVFSVPLPASVIGLLLLLAGLRLGIIAERWIDSAAHFLSANMAFFFLPSAVEIIENYHSISPILIKLIIICTISTILTFLAAYATVQVLQKITGKGEARHD